MIIIEHIRARVKFYIAGVMRRFSKIHIHHDYYVVSDETSYTGFRIIIEKCRICGRIRDSLDC